MGAVVTKHSPTPEERDERVKVELPAEVLVEGVLQAGPHPDEDETDDTC